MNFDLIIIGAGASGLSAAYQAALLMPDAKILILEKEKCPGRKLSAAGNGKCNLTNDRFESVCYHSSNKEMINDWVKLNAPQDVIRFFNQLGILLYQTEGYYYPKSNQGKQVTNILYERCKQMGVIFKMNNTCSNISKKEQSGYIVEVFNQDNQKSTYEALYVIVSTGGMAAPKLGGDNSGITMVNKLGVGIQKMYPALSPIYVKDNLLKIAKGVRLDACVTLKGKEGTIKERGQVQFNEKCVSGIVIMNLSCYFNKWHQNSNIFGEEQLYIDCLPDISWEQLKKYFLEQQNMYPNEKLNSMLSCIFSDAFSFYIIKRLGLNDEMIILDLTDKQINRLTSLIKKLTFEPIYQEEFDKAQVTGGGVDLSEINMNSFESNKYPNLYITGELLDVHGICGGYNLTFAVLSGTQASKDIMKKMRR